MQSTFNQSFITNILPPPKGVPNFTGYWNFSKTGAVYQSVVGKAPECIRFEQSL
jgi:hypothetical protein